MPIDKKKDNFKKKEIQIPMTEPEKEIAYAIMQEVGLDVDKYNHLVDQDTNTTLKFDGKFITSPGSSTTRSGMEFNPMGNVKMASHIFGYYADKLEQEDDGTKVNISYSVDTDEKTGKGYLEVRDEDNNSLRSKEYCNDSLRYADMIFRLSGENDDIDFSAYDAPKEIKKKEFKRTYTKPTGIRKVKRG